MSMRIKSLNMSLGIEPVPKRLYKRGISGAKVHDSMCSNSEKKKPVRLTEAQRSELESNIEASTVGREKINALHLFDEFVKIQTTECKIMIPLDQNGNMISRYFFASIVNELRNKNELDKKGAKYMASRILEGHKNGLNVIQITEKLGLTREWVRVVLKRNNMYVKSKYHNGDRYKFRDIVTSRIYKFSTRGEARSCQNSAYLCSRRKNNLYFSTSVRKEGDFFVCEVKNNEHLESNNDK